MNKAEELIACLEVEIAKRDARIVELSAAHDHYIDQVESADAELTEAKKLIAEQNDELHVADQASKADQVIIDQLRAELAAIKAQDTVGEVVGWYRLDRPYEMTSYPSVCATWHKLGAPVAPLYAAPVSEAKAQGVVKWPEADEIMQMAFEEGQPADDASGYCFELEEFDLFIERLMSDVARLNASPAAPAADAGLVEALGYQALFDAIAAATSVYANGAVNISVQAFRDALAAHSAKGVV